jgi:hypothetical protein
LNFGASAAAALARGEWTEKETPIAQKSRRSAIFGQIPVMGMVFSLSVT